MVLSMPLTHFERIIAFYSERMIPLHTIYQNDNQHLQALKYHWNLKKVDSDSDLAVQVKLFF